VSYTTHADLGGRLGFGRVVPEPEGELFHASWEPGVLALVLAMGATGAWNIDMSRAARETLPDYDRLTYYEIWFAALVKLLAERHLVEADEVASGRALHAAPPLDRRLLASDVAAVLAKGSPTLRPVERQARYRVGDRVRMYAGAVPHHTRLPGYVRGKRGVVDRVHGVHVFADAHALGRGEQPHWLYGVVFDGRDLWPGDGSETRLKVGVDAWEPYLEPA
jgi:nitrile hydratase beta subunit